MGQLITYGGDPAIIATRAEIERVQQGLAAAANILHGELEFGDFLRDLFQPLKRVGLAMELPAVSEKINYLLHALEVAANEYFDGEALVAKELTDIGLFSAPVIAAALLWIGNDAGLVRESNKTASATAVWSFKTVAPTSLGELAQRTAGIVKPGQIIVERYGQTFIAYIPGTQSWWPLPNKNPLDLTSNLNAMKATGLAASEKGLEMALAKSGAGAQSKIFLVGHSQGGIIAANLALRDKRVAGVVSFGAPIGQVAERIKIPLIAIEHSNDLVPKLGLRANPMVENMVTVVREVQITRPLESVVEAHDILNYQKTAELADNSQEVGLKRVRGQLLDAIASGTTHEDSVFKGTVINGPGQEGSATAYELNRN